MMDLVYIAQCRIPSEKAYSVHVMKMCQAFSELGHDTTLVVPDDRDLNTETGIYEFYEVEDNFDIVRLPFPKVPKLGAFIYGTLFLLMILKRRPDVVYGRSMTGCFFSVLVGIKTVFEEHQPGPSDLVSRMIYENLLDSNRLIMLVTITEKLSNYFVDRYPQLRTKIVTAHDGADPIPRVEDTDLLVDNDKPLQVGYVGHLYKGKGMEIISEIAPDCPFAYFHIVGGNEEDIRHWKQKLSGTDNVHFYGHRPHSQAVRFLSLFDVVLAPYLSDVRGSGGQTNLSRWMSPLKIFEYMSAGKPILCSDLPVLNEVLTDGKDAILIDPTSPSDWVDTLERISKDRCTQRKLGNNALEEFEENYTWKKRAEYLTEEMDNRL